MSLDYSWGKIENWEDVVWLPIPHGEKHWDQKTLEANYRNRSGSYLREDEDDDTSRFVKYFNPVTNILIWATLDVQIGEITEKNYKEFWMRMVMADAVEGSGRYNEYIKEKEDWVPRSITIDEVYQHIGLSTNVFPKMSTTKWYNNKLKYVRDAKAAKAKEEAA